MFEIKKIKYGKIKWMLTTNQIIINLLLFSYSSNEHLLFFIFKRLNKPISLNFNK